MLSDALFAALGVQQGTVREMDVDMPARGQDTNLPEDGVKGTWSKEEDDNLRQLVQQHGLKNWNVIASFLPGRIGKRCQERWTEHGNPDIEMGKWTPEEESTLIHAQRVYSTKWAKIAPLLPGRPPNMIKNHWNSTMQTRHAPVLFLCLVSAHVCCLAR
jgi:hypothetical protein